MGTAKNEERICEAVIRLLEEDTGAERRDVRYPEIDHVGPPVERRFKLDGKSYALEHTLVEPFAGHIQAQSEFSAFVTPLIEELDGALPKPGIYILYFPVQPTADRHRRTHTELRDRIAEWVREAAASLHSEAPARQDRHHSPHGFDDGRSASFEGLELRLRRRVHWSETERHDGRFFVQRVIDDDLEEKRFERIAIALDRKLEKLAACRDEGDRTILVLENEDFVLSNESLIANALERVIAGRTDLPDYLAIAETISLDSWSFYFPVRGREFFRDFERMEITPPETAPA